MLIHLGGHKIGYVIFSHVILIWSRLQVGTLLCGDFSVHLNQRFDSMNQNSPALASFNL